MDLENTNIVDNESMEVMDDTSSKLEATTKLLEEATQKINTLTAQVNELKVSNQEMALRVGINKPVTDKDLFMGFSKYSKGGK